MAEETTLYSPLQPAVTEKGEHVTYREFLPHFNLQAYVYCYWQLKTVQPLQHPFSYRVVADGCIDIAFNMRQPDESIAIGFYDTFNHFPLENEFNFVGIRFLPAMFPQIFGIAATELSNCMLPLEIVLPTTARFICDHIRPEYTIEKVAQVFDVYFAKEVSKLKYDPDIRFKNALRYIVTHQGALCIKDEIDTGFSSRQLRRVFNFYVGASPKSFAQVVRFQNILRAKPSLQSLRENKLFYDVGYYDQAHFIKEFRNFYGVTPSQAFGKQE